MTARSCASLKKSIQKPSGTKQMEKRACTPSGPIYMTIHYSWFLISVLTMTKVFGGDEGFRQ